MSIINFLMNDFLAGVLWEDESEESTPPRRMKYESPGIHSGFETQSRDHQRSKIKLSVAQLKWLISSKNISKIYFFNTDINWQQRSPYDRSYLVVQTRDTE